MDHLAMIERMREAMRCYRIDQPDSYTVAIYGPDNFYELHYGFAEAFERKEELTLLAITRALMTPSKAMLDAGEQAMASGCPGAVWRAVLEALLEEGEAAGGRAAACVAERKNAPVRPV